MKIYLMTDLEGVSGVVEFEDRKDETPRNLALRQKYFRLLAGEVNAAIDGAFAAGATEVLVDDAHGGCYTIDFELLDKRARVLHGRERPQMMAGLDESFAGMLFVGAHAMARTRGGVLYHTMSTNVREIRINGRPIGEIGIFMFAAGSFGVPTLLVTGDSAACREAAELMPNLVTVPVKEGLSRYCAISTAPQQARELIYQATKQAIRKRGQIRPYRLRPPFTYQEDVFKAKDANCRASHPEFLPKTWKTGALIRASSAGELIEKVWARKV